MMSLLLPFALMLMQVGIDPRAGGVPGAPPELRDRPPRGAAAESRIAPRPAIDVCLDTARSDPAKARGIAEEWVARTTGAQRATGYHCLGVAAGNAGDWGAAASAFGAARDGAQDARFKARMGILAGSALMAQDRPDVAIVALDQARIAAEGDASLCGEIAIERAIALVALDREGEAGAALAEARGLAPANPATWLLSATLARRQGDLAVAQQHIERAVALDPHELVIGLEAGVIAALGGRDAAARRSFESVIAGAPDSEQAATARQYLAQLAPRSGSDAVARPKTQ